jgi:hypothetical protein
MRHRTHGMSYSRPYGIWRSMKERCLNKNSPAWRHYGGRGITVCDRWMEFENFYADMGDPPAGMELDRIDNDGPYTKENCRWATIKQQGRNRRTNRMITFRGETKCVTEWAESLGMRPSALIHRLDKGWPVEEAMTAPLVPRKLSRTWRVL